MAGVAALDSKGGPIVISDLLRSDANRHGIYEQYLNLSTATTTPDGGIDAETNLTFGIPALNLPAGWHVWQVKTGTAPPRPAHELRARKTPRDVRKAIAEGADYVLVWTVDEPAAVAETKRKAFVREARKIRDDVKVHVVLVSEIATWATPHFNVINRLIDFDGFGPLRSATGTEIRNGMDHIERRIDNHLRSREIQALRLIGPPGCGKTTAIVIAANDASDELPTFIAWRPTDAVLDTVARLARDRIEIGLVIENCPAEFAEDLEGHVATSEGTLRIITEHHIDDPAPFQRTQVIPVENMMPGSHRDLLEALGVDPARARELAEMYGFNARILAIAATEPPDAVTRAIAALIDGIHPAAMAAFALSYGDLGDPVFLDELSKRFDVSAADLEKAAGAVAATGMAHGAQWPRLPKVVAIHAVRDAMVRRRATFRTALARLDDDGIVMALNIVGPCGPTAVDEVDELLSRLPDPELGMTTTTDGWDLEAWLSTVGSAASASPKTVATRFATGVALIPWRDPELAPTWYGLEDVIARTCFDLQQTYNDDGAGAKILLSAAAAAGPLSRLDQRLSAMLSVDYSGRHGDPLHDVLPEIAVPGSPGRAAFLRAAAGAAPGRPELARLAAWFAAEAPGLRSYAADVIAAAIANGHHDECVELIHQPMWEATQLSRMITAVAEADGDVIGELSRLDEDTSAAVVDGIMSDIANGRGSWPYGVRDVVPLTDRLTNTIANVLRARGDGVALVQRHKDPDGWTNLELEKIERLLGGTDESQTTDGV